MKYSPINKIPDLFSAYWKNIVSVAAIIFIIHSLVEIISIYVMEKHSVISVDKGFLIHLFSIEVVPNLIAYIVLFAIMFFLYNRIKWMMMILNNHEVKMAHKEGEIESAQQITGVLIEEIAVWNAQIKEWILFRRSKGQEPPAKVEQANQKIEQALKSMSENSFVEPYT